MNYLLDTDIIIYGLNKRSSVLSEFLNNKHIPKAISVITYGELYFGAKKSKKVEKNLATVFRIGEIFPILEVTRSIMEIFGELKANLQKRGESLADMDLLIGSTAIAMNYCLVTNNERHFSKIPGIQIENWSKTT